MEPIDDSELRDLESFSILEAEIHRVDGFAAVLADSDWTEPTRCEGWTRREVIAHLAGDEEYALACLNGRVQELLEEAGHQGVTSLDSWNAWQVRRRAASSVADVLAEWRLAAAEAPPRLRALGWDGRLETKAGAYPAGLQALHYALEYAVHADDIGVPIADGEGELRTRWRVRVARFAVREQARPVHIEEQGGINQVQLAADPTAVAELSDGELVDAVHARLPKDFPLGDALREGLRTLA